MDADKTTADTVKANYAELRCGAEVIVDRCGEPERWRQICHPRCKLSAYETCYFAVSSHGRLVANDGHLVGSATTPRNNEGYPTLSLSGTLVTVRSTGCTTFRGANPPKDGVE